MYDRWNLLNHCYAPVWKTYVLCRGNVRSSLCLSVFSGLFWKCFEMSIWNLVYTFSMWHEMASLSFITIGLLWPSLQPKVGQTYFLQSWPHKSRQILPIWNIDGPLYTYRHKFRFLQNITFFGILAIINGRLGFFRHFLAFFLHVLMYQFDTWYIHLARSVTC